MNTATVSLSPCLPFSLSMNLTYQQLTTISARAFPGDQLREGRGVGSNRYELHLAGGDRLFVLGYETQAEAQTAATALRLLRGEFDLPLPQLRAADEQGETVGLPYVLVSGIEGQPLAEMREHVPDGQLYAIGQQLGEAAQRIHRLSTPYFGTLVGSTGEADERAYAIVRLEQGLAACRQIGLLNNAAVEAMRDWFAATFRPSSKQAALVHGNLSPETVLVRRIGASWKLGGIVGWERALGWSPAWEHANLFEATDPMPDFSLRVGYGNGYDERTQRTYEQVREIVMVPYRALLLLEQIEVRHIAGDSRGAARAKQALLNLMQMANS